MSDNPQRIVFEDHLFLGAAVGFGNGVRDNVPHLPLVPPNYASSTTLQETTSSLHSHATLDAAVDPGNLDWEAQAFASLPPQLGRGVPAGPTDFPLGARASTAPPASTATPSSPALHNGPQMPVEQSLAPDQVSPAALPVATNRKKAALKKSMTAPVVALKQAIANLIRTKTKHTLAVANIHSMMPRGGPFILTPHASRASKYPKTCRGITNLSAKQVKQVMDAIAHDEVNVKWIGTAAGNRREQRRARRALPASAAAGAITTTNANAASAPPPLQPTPPPPDDSGDRDMADAVTVQRQQDEQVVHDAADGGQGTFVNATSTQGTINLTPEIVAALPHLPSLLRRLNVLESVLYDGNIPPESN